MTFEQKLELLKSFFGGDAARSRENIKTQCAEHKSMTYFMMMNTSSAGKGLLKIDVGAGQKGKSKATKNSGSKRVNLPKVEMAVAAAPTAPTTVEYQGPDAAALAKLSVPLSSGNYVPQIPESDPDFVSFGVYANLKTVIATGQFFPVFVTGDSGNGKTITVQQICSQLGRPLEVMSIKEGTAPEDFIGQQSLVDGSTVFIYGPLLRAMNAGAVILLDEIDRASPKALMAIQNILNGGKSHTIDATGEIVTAAPGFNIIATGNTKGQGDAAGRFATATVLDESTLERFPITLEQEYPPIAVERRIMIKKLGSENAPLCDQLVKWANATRDGFKNNTSANFITTRRLTSIATTIGIFGDAGMAVGLATSRFDKETAESFQMLFEAMAPEAGSTTTSTTTDDAAPAAPAAPASNGMAKPF